MTRSALRLAVFLAVLAVAKFYLLPMTSAAVSGVGKQIQELIGK